MRSDRDLDFGMRGLKRSDLLVNLSQQAATEQKVWDDNQLFGAGIQGCFERFFKTRLRDPDEARERISELGSFHQPVGDLAKFFIGIRIAGTASDQDDGGLLCCYCCVEWYGGSGSL